MDDDPKHIPQTSAHYRPTNIISWLYLQYLIVSGLYMLERWERIIVNLLLLLFLFMIGYSAYRIVPGNVKFVLWLVRSFFGGSVEAQGKSVEL